MTGEIDIDGIKVKEKLNDMVTKSYISSTYLTISDAEDDYATKNHTHSNYLTKTTADSSYATRTHTHSNYASSSHTHDSLYSGSSLKLVVGTNVRPGTDNSTNLGYTNYRWLRVYSTNSTISTSDERLKTLISDIDERYEKTFMDLKPVTYMWKNTESNSTHDRVHCGFIAQQANDVAEKNGLSSNNFAFVCHDSFDQPVDGLNDMWSLAYSELHGLEVHMIQKAIHRIESLEEENASLKEQIQNIQEQLNSLLSK